MGMLPLVEGRLVSINLTIAKNGELVSEKVTGTLHGWFMQEKKPYALIELEDGSMRFVPYNNVTCLNPCNLSADKFINDFLSEVTDQ